MKSCVSRSMLRDCSGLYSGVKSKKLFRLKLLVMDLLVGVRVFINGD